MSIRTSSFCPPPPTWRLCHPVNIYVYQNGLEHTRPCLVHIPMEKKKNMKTVLEEIGSRMKLTVGYPVALYHMDGTRVCKTYELEMYNNYVVVTNLEKRFKCVDYGKEKAPLVVIGRGSKHVNTLRLQKKRYDLFCRAKMRAKPLHELMAASGESDGYGPDNLPIQGRNCGALCHKPTESRSDRPTQCCSDEIMCVEDEGVGMLGESEIDCKFFEKALERREMEERMRGTPAPPSTQMTDEDCKMIEELRNKCRSVGGLGESEGKAFDTGQCGADGAGPLGINQNLIDLMLRYKDVGSDIFRLFQDKIQRDKEAERMGVGAKDTISARWQIHGESNLSLQTEERVKNDLLKLAQQTCQFTFDKKGNFLFSEGCNVGEGELSNFKFDSGVKSQNFCADANQFPNDEGGESTMVSKGEGTPGFATSRQFSDSRRDDSFLNSQGGFEGEFSDTQGGFEGDMSTGTYTVEECDEGDEKCLEKRTMQSGRSWPSKPLSQNGTTGFTSQGFSNTKRDSFLNSQGGFEGEFSDTQGGVEGQMSRGYTQDSDSRQNYTREMTEECDEGDEKCLEERTMQSGRSWPSKPLSQNGIDGGSATQYSNGMNGGTPTQYSNGMTGETPTQYSNGMTGETPTQYSNGINGGSGRQYSNGMTGGTPTQYSNGMNGGTPTQYSNGMTGETPTQYSNGMNGGSGRQYSNGMTGGTPTQYSNGMNEGTATQYSNGMNGGSGRQYSNSNVMNSGSLTQYSNGMNGGTPTQYSNGMNGGSGRQYSNSNVMNSGSLTQYSNGMNGGGTPTQYSNGMRVSNMQSEISEIVGNARRSLTMTRSNSFKGGRLSRQNSQGFSTPLETLIEEDDDGDLGDEDEEIVWYLDQLPDEWG